MTSTSILDTNVILRFLLDDHPQLSAEAKSIFLEAQNSGRHLYLDETVTAEVIWVLQSYYRHTRSAIATQLLQLFSYPWITNPRKRLVIASITRYTHSNLDYIDCWLHTLSKSKKLPLTTFDRRLKKSTN